MFRTWPLRTGAAGTPNLLPASSLPRRCRIVGDAGVTNSANASRVCVEQPQLEHARRVEALDPQRRARRGGGGARRHEPDELGADDLGAARPRLCLHALDDLVQRRPPPSPPRSCSPARRPHAAGRARARARRGSRRRARARPTRSRARPRRVAPPRFTLNAINGRRAPTITPPARSSSRPGPKSGVELARRRAAAASSRPARAEERRPAARRELAVEEHGQRQLAHRSAARARARTRAHAPGPPGTIGTTGTTSAAPIRGCAPSCSRRSIRSRATATAASSASTSSLLGADQREHRPVVIRVAVHVEQARVRSIAAPIASIVARSRPSEKFGTDSRTRTRVL